MNLIDILKGINPFKGHKIDLKNIRIISKDDAKISSNKGIGDDVKKAWNKAKLKNKPCARCGIAKRHIGDKYVAAYCKDCLCTVNRERNKKMLNKPCARCGIEKRHVGDNYVSAYCKDCLYIANRERNQKKNARLKKPG